MELNINLPHNPAIPLVGIYLLKRNENIYPPQDLYVNVCSRLTHNHQKLETIQMAIKRQMKKQIVVSLYNELTTSQK